MRCPLELAPGGPLAATAGRQAFRDIEAAIQSVLPASACDFETIAGSDLLLASRRPAANA